MDEHMIDISGLDKAELFAALYNHARPQGMGFLSASNDVMTVEEAKRIMDNRGNVDYYDYVKGRVMKIYIGYGLVATDPTLYDRDNGEGAARRIVGSLRGK